MQQTIVSAEPDYCLPPEAEQPDYSLPPQEDEQIVSIKSFPPRQPAHSKQSSDETYDPKDSKSSKKSLFKQNECYWLGNKIGRNLV